MKKLNGYVIGVWIWVSLSCAGLAQVFTVSAIDSTNSSALPYLGDYDLASGETVIWTNGTHFARRLTTNAVRLDFYPTLTEAQNENGRIYRSSTASGTEWAGALTAPNSDIARAVSYVFCDESGGGSGTGEIDVEPVVQQILELQYVVFGCCAGLIMAFAVDKFFKR